MAKPKFDANQVENFEYDNTTSGLSATDGQAAIDEIVALLANYLQSTGSLTLPASFNIGLTANENKILIPTGTANITIEAGTSPIAKSSVVFGSNTISFSFDGGAIEYVIRKGGTVTDDDIINKGYLDGRIGNMIESDITGLGASAVQINNIVALNQSDYDAIAVKDPSTYYLITDSATNFDYIGVACSGVQDNIIVGNSAGYFRMPYSATLNSVRASVWQAPTGSNIDIQIRKNTGDVLSTKLVIDAGSETSVGSNTTPVISDANFIFDDKVNIDIDQVGSTEPGKGLIVYLEFIKN
jgi:hypothetical protein